MFLIGSFEAIEVVSLAFSIITFIFIYKAYKGGFHDSVAKKFWTYFLLIALFSLLSRTFSNIESVAFMPYFNLLEHLSRLAASVVFVLVGKNTLEGKGWFWLVDFADIISNNWLIIGIEAGTSILLIIAFFYTQKIYRMTKKTTDIWLLISFAVLVFFLASVSVILEIYYNNSEAFHNIGEYLKNIYSLVWIYIAFRFISLRQIK